MNTPNQSNNGEQATPRLPIDKPEDTNKKMPQNGNKNPQQPHKPAEEQPETK